MSTSGPTAGTMARTFQEIRNTPRLSRDDECALARRIRQGHDEAINDLVTPNLAFVAKTARRYCGMGVPFEDLMHEGSLGLIEAARRFDGNRDTRFIGYAVWWIRKYLAEAVARQGPNIRVPLARGPRPDGDARRRPRRFREISLESTTTVDGGLALSEVLTDPHAVLIDDRLIHDEAGWCVDDAVARLPRVERFVLRHRFGLAGTGEQTLNEVGRAMGVTRERVRQIEIRAKTRLRRILRTRYCMQRPV